MKYNQHNDVVVVGTIGRPGSQTSAMIDPLDMGTRTDVGQVVEEEVDEVSPQIGYHEDLKKYEKQVKEYNENSKK